MNAFSRYGSALLLLAAGSAHGEPGFPVISSPFAQLRKAPVFSAEIIPQAKTWGVSLPIGTPFQVEKVYGRWVFGRPSPLANMRTADYSPPGWIFSRQLLVPGDSDTLSPAQLKASRNVLFHGRATRKKLGDTGASPTDFLETLTLSRKTLEAFSIRDKEAAKQIPFSLHPISEALANEKEPAPMGLIGADLTFLDQEIKVIQDRKQREARQREAKKLKAPAAPPLDDGTRTGVLGRYLLERYLDLPPLTMEEVDGHIYLRATATRALRGCPKETQDYWKNRRWAHFRVFRLKSRPEVKQPWLELALPGGYFAVSARAIEQASNEAELAYLLVRQLVREPRVKRKATRFDAKAWPQSLPALSEEIWDLVLKAQSTKDSEHLDVADEIAVDMIAAECIARAGYRPMAGLAYLKNLFVNKEEPWAEWFSKNSIGLGYRIERLATLIQESVAQQKFPDGSDSQTKRFAAASRQWNILP